MFAVGEGFFSQRKFFVSLLQRRLFAVQNVQRRLNVRQALNIAVKLLAPICFSLAPLVFRLSRCESFFCLVKLNLRGVALGRHLFQVGELARQNFPVGQQSLCGVEIFLERGNVLLGGGKFFGGLLHGLRARVLYPPFQGLASGFECILFGRSDFGAFFQCRLDFLIRLGIEQDVQNLLAFVGVGGKKFIELALRQQNHLPELLGTESQKLRDFAFYLAVLGGNQPVVAIKLGLLLILVVFPFRVIAYPAPYAISFVAQAKGEFDFGIDVVGHAL